LSVEETVAGLLRAATARLEAAGVDSPATDARVLLAHSCGCEPRELLGSKRVDQARAGDFQRLVERRAERIPLQHLTGRAHFRYLELAVGPGVFVPRPETEVMTGWAVVRLEELVRAGRRPIAVDLGTGSGAIAKALTTEVPEAVVHAVELADDALAWARINLGGTTVALHAEDLAHALPELDGTVDLVVANPPYIPLEAFASVAPEARDHDPTVALFSGVDGLNAIRRVALTAGRLLRPGGLLAVEHAEVQGETVPEILVRTGFFASVRDHTDLTGRPRFTTAVSRPRERSR
jgi:release factor glutamine methyltransferase